MSIDANIIDCEWIKAAAKSAGIRTAVLIALSMNNDPFYAGRPADWEKANWFAEIFERFGFGQGVHVRRIFYRCVTEDVLHWDGSVFENTDKHWSDIQNASKYARSLGIVDAREEGTISWSWIVDETRHVEQIATWADPLSVFNRAATQYRKNHWAEWRS